MRSKRLLLLTLMVAVNVASAAIILTPREAQATAPTVDGCKDEACWTNSTSCFYLPGGKCNPQSNGTCYVTACGDS